MKMTPAASRYEPSTKLTKVCQSKGLSKVTQPRFDDYSFKKMINKAPSPALYEVAYSEEVGREDKYRAKKLVRNTNYL